ncbi:hypothetical protein Tco_0348116 [Tanacetum coccineum]
MIGYGEEVSAKGTLRKSVNTFRNAIGAHYLPYSSEYVAPPSIDVVRLKKKQREKVVPYTRFLSLLIMHKMKERYGDDEVTLYPTQVFSVNNWALKSNQLEEPPFTTHMLAICSADKLVVFKAPKPSSNVERVLQGTNPGAKHGHKKHSTSSKQPSVSSKEPPVPTPVDTRMLKEDQQATGGPTSLGVTSEAIANPQLSSCMSTFNLNKPIYSAAFIIHSESASGNDALAASTVEADPRNSAPSTDPLVLTDQTKYVSEGLETILTQPITGKGASSVANLDSPEDDHVIVVNDSDEDEDDEVHATKNSQKYKLELEKNKAEAKVALFKAQPSLLNVEQLKELLELELPGDLKEITPKLEDFAKTVTSLTSKVVKLKTLQWELPAEFLVVPSQVEMVWAKLKTLDALPSLLNKVTNALNHPPKGSSQTKGEHIKKDKGKKALSSEEVVKESTESDSDGDETHLSRSMVESSRIKKVKKFDFVTEDGKHIHLTEEQINQQKKIEEEAKAEGAKHEIEVRKEELIDLLGPKVVNKYYNDKLQYDRYYDKMLNRRAISRITNYDVLTKKGPIILKVYREDGTNEIIPNFKASDMHLGEWR